MSAGGLLLDPADRARRQVLRVAALTAIGRACVRDRALRLPALALAHGAVALVLATAAPMWTLLIGPLVLGVPHLVADLRYLVLDRPAGLRIPQLATIALPLAFLTVAGALVPGSALALTIPGLAAVAGAIAFSRAGAATRVFSLLALTAVAIPLCLEAPRTLLLLAHAHNAIAVALWLALARERTPLRWLAATILLAGGALIASGALDFVPLATGGWITPAAGFDPESVGDSLALPGLAASRSLMLYAYAQAVHYAVWLRLVPGERSPSEAPVSFRRGFEGLRAALGRPAFAATIAVAIAVPLAGLLWEAAQARHLYLQVAGFHAWLEIAVGAHLVLAWRGAAR